MSSFMHTLSHLNKGGTIQELDEALAELTRQCRLTGKPGSVTLKLNLKPMKDGAVCEVSDSISVSTPPLPRKTSIFFTTDEGVLSRNDPDQPELHLQVQEGGLKAETDSQLQQKAS